MKRKSWKSKKIAAAVLAIGVMSGYAPMIINDTNNFVISASAADYTEYESDNMLFKVYEDHAELAKATVKTIVSADIPSVVSGVPVTIIGSNAFQDCKSLETVILPDTLKTISSNAFHTCSVLKEIEISNSVESIGNGAFEANSALEKVTLGNNLKTIENRAFLSCKALKEISIPDSVEKIGGSAFEACSVLETVTLGNGLKTISDSCFSSCKNLSSITFGKNIETVGSNALQSCTSLKTISGYDDTYAQTFAAENGYEFISLGTAPEDEKINKGDVNEDGLIDIADAAITLTMYASSASGLDMSNYTEKQLKTADVDENGSVAINDAAYILTYYANTAAGIEVSFDSIISKA